MGAELQPPISLFVTLDVSPSSEQMCNYQSAVPLLLQVQLISPSHHDLLYLAFPSHCNPPGLKTFATVKVLVLADRCRYANHVIRSMVWWKVVIYFSGAVVLLPLAVVLRFTPIQVEETSRSSCGSENQRPAEDTSNTCGGKHMYYCISVLVVTQRGAYQVADIINSK